MAAVAAAIVGDALKRLIIDEVVELTRLMVGVPSPSGEERPLAHLVAEWGRAHAPHVNWRVDDVGAPAANVHGEAGRGERMSVALLSHLDTSLTGRGSEDEPVTGRADEPPAFRFHEGHGVLSGFGVGVAKAPAAAAAVTFGAATAALDAADVSYRLGLLLAAGGTHRARAGHAGSTTFATGVRHALDCGWRPAAVVNAKCGPPGVLFEEPGALYLAIDVQGRFSAASRPEAAAPPGGMAARVGVVLDAIDSWRTAYLARQAAGRGQIRREVAIGAIQTGSPAKPDLLPGRLSVSLYVVVGLDDEPAEVAGELQRAVQRALDNDRWPAKVRVSSYGFIAAGTTDPRSRLVEVAELAYRNAGGTPTRADPWRGSTDGALLRARGIDTVRIGPRMTTPADDPRREEVSLAELALAARAWLEIVVRMVVAEAGSYRAATRSEQ